MHVDRCEATPDFGAARILGQPIGDLLIDHLVLIRALAGRVGVIQQNRAYRNPRLVEEFERLIGIGTVKSIDQLRFAAVGLRNGLRSKGPIRLRLRRATSLYAVGNPITAGYSPLPDR
jgi:hypothetical protein